MTRVVLSVDVPEDVARSIETQAVEREYDDEGFGMLATWLQTALQAEIEWEHTKPGETCAVQVQWVVGL